MRISDWSSDVCSSDLGVTAALWVFGMVCAADIGAYFAGRAFGGARLAPRISPSKTWSGLIGAMVAALLASATIGDRAGIVRLPLLLGLFVGVIAHHGDLAPSWMKPPARGHGSGHLAPSPGGVS